MEISNARQIGVLAREMPDTPVYTQILADGTEIQLTWPSLDHRSNQLAQALARRGLRKGDRIGIALPNSIHFALTVLASWKIGAVPIPIRWDLPEWELDRLRQVIDSPHYLDLSAVEWIDSTDELAPRPLPDAISPQVNGICSSGSTGTPKVILIERPSTHDPVTATALVEHWMEVQKPEIVLVLGPMYHANGFSAFYRLLAGEQLVVLERFDAANAVDAIERHRVTTFTATPTMLQRIADLPGVDERDFSSIQWVLQGAAPMPPSLLDRWMTLISPERIVMAYGMTEGLGLTGMRADEWKDHQGSVGRGLRDTEVRIRDEDGQDLEPGQIGDVYLRSSMIGGYSYLGGSPELQKSIDGFQTAGDLGYLDDSGYLYVVDRRVDIIISGGANIYPAEVECALIDHPKIADVVVIGLRDDVWGRRVHALVEPQDPAEPPGIDEVIGYAKSRLASYKVPKSIEYVNRMPRSAATKINRRLLIDERGG